MTFVQSQPDLFPMPFAYAGAKNSIPTVSAAPAASLPDGFPTDTMLPVPAGTPPDGEDFNGILNWITQHLCFLNSGQIYQYNAALSATMGGYPKGAIVQNSANTKAYVSVAGSNTNSLTAAEAGDYTYWAPWAGSVYQVLPGTIQMFAGSATPSGYLLCDGASHLRSDYVALFGAISTTWGFADGSHFNVPDMRGCVPVGMGTGTLSAVALTNRVLGTRGGSETHVLDTTEIPAHTHSVQEYSGINGTGTTHINAPVQAGGDGVNTGSTGGGLAHTNMQPWAAINFIVKT